MTERTSHTRPFRLATHEHFQWIEHDGFPVGHVASFGGIAYLLVCPRCGCLHELPGVTFTEVGQTRVIAPPCVGQQSAAQQHSIETWCQQHPQAVNCDRIWTVFVGRGRDLAVDALFQTPNETGRIEADDSCAQSPTRLTWISLRSPRADDGRWAGEGEQKSTIADAELRAGSEHA